MIFMTTEKRDRIGKQMATALDALWTKIQDNHPDVPEVVLFVSPVAHGSDTEKYSVTGHFGAKRWSIPGHDGAVGEVLLVAEQMMRGAAATVETVLHEAAHALADARDIEDTSQGGRYHSAKFKALAEEVGLVVEQMGGRGWAHTSLAEGTLALYEAEAREVGKALIALAKDRPMKTKGPKRQGPLKCICACDEPRVIRISPSVLAKGDIKCGVCNGHFAPEDAGSEAGTDEEADAA